MAGLLIKELKIRGLARRILVVTPANLSFQWQRELQDKFHEHFEIVRGEVLRANYGSNPWQEKAQVITSVSWVSRIEDARESLLRSHWDLIVVDEAHKMSAYSLEHKTLAYQLGEALGELTDHYLLMTATPHKGDPQNFCLFLALLDRDVYGDVKSLQEAMRRAEAPFYLRRVKEALVAFPDPETGEVKALFTKRFVRTAEFQVDADEWDFYNALTRYVEDQSVRAAADDSARGRALGFTMAMLQRRFASSIYAVRRSLERMRDKRRKIAANPTGYRQEQVARRFPEDFDELPDDERQDILEELEEVVASVDPISLQGEIAELERLIHQAKAVEASESESKLTKLRELLADQGVFGDPSMKLLVFTEHKDTLDYLAGRLREWGLSVTQIHGGMKIGDRDVPGTRICAEREFREECQVLVATEAAGEGINLQFCWLMVNYDIPWNPVRLEQRMGRIHRYGQERDCLIFNFVSTNTREGRVLDTLFDRVQAIEADLDPGRTGKVFNVLGDIFPANELERMVRAMYARNLTEDVIKSRIVEQVDAERFRRITSSTLEGLAKRDLNLSAIVGKSAEAKERRLVPEVVEDFFVQAAPLVGVVPRALSPGPSPEYRRGERAPTPGPSPEYRRGERAPTPGPSPSIGRGVAEGRGEGRVYRIGRVPRHLWATGERLEPRFGKLGREYKQVVFDKALLATDPTLEWVTPGHPLFECVREELLARVEDDLRRGAVFYDLNRTEPSRLDVFLAAVLDGRGNVLHRRLFAVETTPDGAMVVRQPTVFLDLTPAQDLTGLPVLSGLHRHDRDEVELTLVDQALQPFLAEVQAQRERETATIERHVEISLNTLIDRLQVQYAGLAAQRDAGSSEAGLEGRLKQAEDRLDELNARLERRRAELAQERQCTIADVQHLGAAWVLPHPERTTPGIAPMVRDEEIERIAVEAVLAYEAAHGRQAVSVEQENRGFDLISRRPHPEDPLTAIEVRFIEVKGRAGVGEVALSTNEYKTAARLGRDYWLYAVFNCGSLPEVHPIQDPARLGWKPVVAVEHYRIEAEQLLDARE
jgi:superfamily II DNA or RNA helicase